MGIDVTLYRLRIGTFCMPRKCRFRMDTICVSGRTMSVVLRLVLFLSVLVVMGGDVELNPGPPRSQRQKTLSFAETADSPTLRTEQRRTSVSTSANNEELSVFMREMREMRGEMKTDLTSINSKIDDINRTVNTLKVDNERLRTENREIREELEVVRANLDRLEGFSRRNNLIFHGIPGNIGENWQDCEQKVREIIRDDLGLQSHEQAGIERAHRIGGRNRGDRRTSSVIVKFSSYKDKDAILRKARQTLDRNSQYQVQEDYTDRVKRHRRELGKRLVEARESGQYAAMRFDKLIIDNEVYKYDEKTEQIILIGAARGRTGFPPRGQNYRANDNGRQNEAGQSRGQSITRQNDADESDVEAADDVVQGGRRANSDGLG